MALGMMRPARHVDLASAAPPSLLLWGVFCTGAANRRDTLNRDIGWAELRQLFKKEKYLEILKIVDICGLSGKRTQTGDNKSPKNMMLALIYAVQRRFNTTNQLTYNDL